MATGEEYDERCSIFRLTGPTLCRLAWNNEESSARNRGIACQGNALLYAQTDKKCYGQNAQDRILSENIFALRFHGRSIASGVRERYEGNHTHDTGTETVNSALGAVGDFFSVGSCMPACGMSRSFF